MSGRHSLSKDKIRVLLLEGVNDSAADLFSAAGYGNMTRLGKALEGEALHEALAACICLASDRARNLPPTYSALPTG